MSLKLNLVVEKPDVNDEFEYIEEEVDRNSPSNLYIKGPYMMAEGVNKNNRLYPLDELQREAARYIEEMVTPGRAMGELNHPTTADVDLERACHMVTELTQDGNVFYGKSKVLSTPCGQIVRSLINDGVKYYYPVYMTGIEKFYQYVINLNLMNGDTVKAKETQVKIDDINRWHSEQNRLLDN